MKTIFSLIGLVTVVVAGIFGKKTYDKYQLKKGIDDVNNGIGTGGNGTDVNLLIPPSPAELAQQKHLQDLQFTKFMRINREYLQLKFTGAKALLHNNPTYIKYNNLATERNKAIEDANTLKVVLPTSLIYEDKQKEILNLTLQIKESLVSLNALNPMITMQGNSFMPSISLPNPDFVNQYNTLIDKTNALKAQRASAYKTLTDNKVLIAPIVANALGIASRLNIAKATVSAVAGDNNTNFDGMGNKQHIY